MGLSPSRVQTLAGPAVVDCFLGLAQETQRAAGSIPRLASVSQIRACGDQ